MTQIEVTTKLTHALCAHQSLPEAHNCTCIGRKSHMYSTREENLVVGLRQTDAQGAQFYRVAHNAYKTIGATATTAS